MSSPFKKQPEDVADCVLRRAEVSKIARRLQNRLALAQFKTKHGWEDLTLDIIEPKVEEEMRRRRLFDGDFLSDSSSSASDLPYPTKALMSSPLKAPLFSDTVGSSNGSSGHRKRTYLASPDGDNDSSSPAKRYRLSPTAHRSFAADHPVWKDQGHHHQHHQQHHQHQHQHHHILQSSPFKLRRQQHFTTSAGPDLSFFPQRRSESGFVTSNNYAAPDDDDDELLPAHSFTTTRRTTKVNLRSSPPRTPPMHNRSLPGKRNKSHGAGRGPGVGIGAGGGGGGAGAGSRPGGEEGADLLLYLATSPSPAVKANRIPTDRPSTPPPKNSKLDLPSSMMTTPGGGTLFPTTPGQGFDFADFVNITPSPAQKVWRTPGGPLSVSRTTPLSVARKRLTFDDPRL